MGTPFEGCSECFTYKELTAQKFTKISHKADVSFAVRQSSKNDYVWWRGRFHLFGDVAPRTYAACHGQLRSCFGIGRRCSFLLIGLTPDD